MAKEILVEVCCGSIDDAIIAGAAGAGRIELNSCLFLGGLTPSMGTFLKAKEKLDIPVMVMVRPRGAGFYYTENEFEVMLEDAEKFVENDADGIVFGFLNPDGTVDYERCKRIVDIIGEKEAVFHRAIDVVPEPLEVLDRLAAIGVKRVLTSGQQPSVTEGAALIKEMVRHAGDRIQILPGGGIRLHNAADIAKATGVNQVHLSALGSRKDESTCGNSRIHFGGALYPPEDRHEIVDENLLTKIIQSLK